MTQKTCLLLKPQPSSADGQLAQQNDMRDLIEEAITASGLKLISPHGGQTINNDIPGELINRVYDADIVVIDVNCYEPNGYFKYSPFLYYLMGMHHTLGNRTILVCAEATRSHLPAALQMRHTLFYGSSVPAAREFARRFTERIEQMVADGDMGEPGNPVQSYRQHKEQKAWAAERERIRAEQEAMKEELTTLKKSVQSASRPSTEPQRINFRPLK